MKRKLPDHRLDWRDPAMPCLEGRVLVDNWSGKVVERKMVEISAEQAQLGAQNRLMQSEFNPQDTPSWRSDPTYNLRRK